MVTVTDYTNSVTDLYILPYCFYCLYCAYVNNSFIASEIMLQIKNFSDQPRGLAFSISDY
jgi:hypothetical protein